VTRSVLVAVAVAGVATAIAALAYGGRAAAITAGCLGPLGAMTALAGDVLATRVRPPWTLRRRLGWTAALVGAEVAVAVGLFVALMFVSAHDALFSVLVVAYAALLGLLVARRIARGALADLEAVRGTLAAVGEGRRDVRTGVEGGGELAELAAEVDAMVARLGAEERARRDLIAAVSHDLRTPITSLRLLADAIEDGILDDGDAADYAARMSTHVRALGALIDDLFELSRLESGELRWSMERVALDELVRDTVEAMRPAAEAGAVAVRARLGGGGAWTQGDPARLQRVLFNLIQNAIRHTPPDGSVTVLAEHVDGAVEIEVADTGTGIAPEHRERVFEPFFRADPARADDGTGLGLAISRAIVEAHGGRIWVAGGDSGTRVRLRLQPG
jgi:signal transduction histidine kinase